jgi:hypothetical protein
LFGALRRFTASGARSIACGRRSCATATSGMKANGDAKSRLIVRQLDRRAVQIGNGLHERKAETAAGRGTARLQP